MGKTAKKIELEESKRSLKRLRDREENERLFKKRKIR